MNEDFEGWKMDVSRIAGCIALLLVCLWGPGVQAGGLEANGPAAHIDAEALIKDCTDRFKVELDSGVTSRMRAGSADIIDCLNEKILEQVRAVMPEPDAAVKRYEAYLNQLSYSHQRIWWEFYNENKSCAAQPCGTLMHVFHLGRHMALLKDMLRNIVHHRQSEGF